MKADIWLKKDGEWRYHSTVDKRVADSHASCLAVKLRRPAQVLSEGKKPTITCPKAIGT